MPASALDVPPLRARVTDLARVLPAARAQALEARLAAHERQTGQQFFLLTVPTLEGDSLEDFSFRVAEAWKAGQDKTDNGLILLVVLGERRSRIEVGYGLEGTIPDAVAARVTRDVLPPAFRAGDYAGGIERAFDVLMRAASGDAQPQPERGAGKQRGGGHLFTFMLLPLLLIMLLRGFGGGGRGGGFGRRRSWGGGPGAFWIGGLGGGGFGGGGGGGGGFGGGGGGDFGGGGASGDW